MALSIWWHWPRKCINLKWLHRTKQSYCSCIKHFHSIFYEYNYSFNNFQLESVKVVVLLEVNFGNTGTKNSKNVCNITPYTDLMMNELWCINGHQYLIKNKCTRNNYIGLPIRLLSIRSLISHSALASSSSQPALDGGHRQQLLKYIPPIFCNSGATVQYTVVAAPCCWKQKYSICKTMFHNLRQIQFYLWLFIFTICLHQKIYKSASIYSKNQWKVWQNHTNINWLTRS